MKKNYYFFQPQKQSKKGLFLLSIYGFLKAIKISWPLIILILIKGKLLYLIMFVVFLAIFQIVKEFLEFHYFSYKIDSSTQELIIEKGVFTKTTKHVQLSKIQSVNINQPFVHKIFGVFQLDMDSPGGEDDKELKIKAINYSNALELKEYILNYKNNFIEKDEFIESEIKISQQKLLPEFSFNFSSFTLLKYGLTINFIRGLTLLLGFGYYVYNKINETNVINHFEGKVHQLLQQAEEIKSVFFWFLIIVLLFSISVLINIIRVFIDFYRFKVEKFGDHLSIEYGLLNSKNKIINKRKIQIVEEEQNYFQKLMDIRKLKLNQMSKVLAKDACIFPGCSKDEVEKLYEFTFGFTPLFQWFLLPNWRRLVPQTIFYVILPIVILYSFQVFWFWIVVYIIIVEILIYFKFKNSKLSFNKNYICIESGAWDRRKELIEIEKIQSVKISQYIWQKKSMIGSIYFYTASGTINFTKGNWNYLKNLANYCIYKIETSKNDWF